MIGIENIRRGALAITLSLLTVSLQAAPAQADRVLQLASDAGDWLAAQGVRQPAGIAWPADANKPADLSYDLGSGTAGQAVYFLALYRATGEHRFLEQAEAGGRYLQQLIGDEDNFADNPRRASLYNGVSGIGVALSLLAEESPDFAVSVTRVVELLEAWNVAEQGGVRWSEDFNDLIFGDAGTILFLADHADRHGDQRALNLAVQGGHFLLAQAQAAESGSYWLFRRSRPFNLPGLSHGTAGTAYVLGTVGGLADDSDLKNAASAGFDYIRSIAEIENGLLRIPYGWPAENWQGLYEFGWAHGIAGACALFTRLQQLGIQSREAARYNALVVTTLSNIGLPGTPEPPFAEPSTPLDMRFGRASVLALLSDYGESIDVRDELWGQIESSAERRDGQAYWEVDSPEFMGGGRAAFTGIFHGTAGIGLSLLRLHASLLKRPQYISLPDDPMAWAGR